MIGFQPIVVKKSAPRLLASGSVHIPKIRDLLKTSAKDGWVLRNQEGSYRQFVHPMKPGKATVNGHPSDDVPPGGAYAPDLPGCIATGTTLAITRRRISDAIAAHLHAMREDGDPVPEPSHVEMLAVA